MFVFAGSSARENLWEIGDTGVRIQLWRALKPPTGKLSEQFSVGFPALAIILVSRDGATPSNTSQEEKNLRRSLACFVAYLINNDYSLTRGVRHGISSSQYEQSGDNSPCFVSFVFTRRSFICSTGQPAAHERGDLSRDNQILIFNGQIYYVIKRNLRMPIKKPSSQLCAVVAKAKTRKSGCIRSSVLQRKVDSPNDGRNDLKLYAKKIFLRNVSTH